MATETVDDILGAVPGARPTSTFRTPEHNRAVGGQPNSFHTRGDPTNPRAVDLVPAPGETMAELEARIRASGVNTLELLNEGDHVHVAVDGKPRQVDAPGVTGNPGYRVVSSEDLAPTDTPENLRAQGYEIDPATNTWVRTVGTEAWPGPEPLDTLYAERQTARETQALDQEEADLRASVVQAGAGVSDNAAAAVLGDIGKGVFLEGGQAVASGVKRGFNAIMDLTDEAGDWIETYVPGTVMWEGFDGDANTPMRIRLTTQNEAIRYFEAKQDGQLSLLQRLGAGMIRAPQTEGERPETVTGRLIEGVTQFATGFVGGGKVLQGWKAAGTAGRIGKNLVQGALADFAAFDGQEARLSNLLAEHAPEALAPALQYLAADEDDGEIEGRFKNAIEGAVLGGAVDLLGVGIRRLRAARQVRTAARDAARAEGLQIDPTLAADEARVGGEQAEAVVREALGNPEAPAFRVKVERQAANVARQPADMADDIATAAPTDNVFDINLSRMDTPENIQNVITGMADRLARDVNLARRATRSHEQTMASARRLDWVTSMAERRPGQAANAEQITAYRLALNASATRLQELAQAVKTASSTPAEAVARQYALRRAATIHAAIQHEFMGARAEAGRALGAFRIAVGTPENSLRQIDSLLADMGSRGTAEGLADAVLKAARQGDVALNQMLRQGWGARTQDAIKFVYTNGLLSGVGTPIVNIAGNAMMLGMNIASRAVAPRMARAFGGEGATQIGEASKLFHGYQMAIRDMFRLAPMEAAQRIGANGGEALRREGLFRGMAPGIEDAAPPGIALRAEREEAGALANTNRPLSAAFWRVDEDTPLGRVLDVMHMVIGAPSNVNALTDDFFKVIAARGELHAQVFRKVAAEGLETEAARARYAQLIDNPDDEMLKAAEEQMHDLTFTRETPGLASDVASFRRNADSWGGPWGTLILPFVRTPANLISMGMRYSPLAPLSRRFRDDLAAGGARAETAKATMAVGTALWSVWMGMAMDGQITGAGPKNGAQKEALMRADEYGGAIWQPYSIKIGERWYSFERADPLGQGLSLIGDMADMMKNDDWNAATLQEGSEVAAHVIMALGSAFFDKTMLKGATDLTSSVLNGTEGQTERTIGRQVAGLIPGSSALRMFRRGQDPYLRETSNIVDAMRNAVPGLSDDLPPQRDLWGKERTYQTGLGTVYDAAVPVQTREAGGSAIDLEILNNGVSVSMPDRSIQVNGERVSLKNRPDIYSRYVELAGQPAFEELNALVEGRGDYSEEYLAETDGPDGGKAQWIKSVITQYREDARAIILDEYAADLQRMAGESQRRREDVRLDR